MSIPNKILWVKSGQIATNICPNIINLGIKIGRQLKWDISFKFPSNLHTGVKTQNLYFGHKLC